MDIQEERPTITIDNGIEFCAHKEIARKLNKLRTSLTAMPPGRKMPSRT